MIQSGWKGFDIYFVRYYNSINKTVKITYENRFY